MKQCTQIVAENIFGKRNEPLKVNLFCGLLIGGIVFFKKIKGSGKKKKTFSFEHDIRVTFVHDLTRHLTHKINVSLEKACSYYTQYYSFPAISMHPGAFHKNRYRNEMNVCLSRSHNLLSVITFTQFVNRYLFGPGVFIGSILTAYHYEHFNTKQWDEKKTIDFNSMSVDFILHHCI